MEPKDFLTFDKMLTPIIIQVLFWIGVALSVLFGLSAIIGGMRSSFGGGATVFMGLVWLVLGPILTRVYCELLMVVFKIHGSLVEIKQSLRENPAGSTASPPASPPVPPPAVPGTHPSLGGAGG